MTKRYLKNILSHRFLYRLGVMRLVAFAQLVGHSARGDRLSATRNNPCITGMRDCITGERVTQQYDSLQRLISAATTAVSRPVLAGSMSMAGLAN
jgi:hypothetical protein